jgi:hypothetical protein
VAERLTSCDPPKSINKFISVEALPALPKCSELFH